MNIKIYDMNTINYIILNDIKEYNIKIFSADIKKLKDINKNNNDLLYYTTDITNKHIIKLEKNFNNIISNLNNISDIIQLFKISNTNKKLKDYNSISYSNYYLCNNLLNKNCKNCKICYYAKNERFNNVMLFRLKNYIFFNTLMYLYKTNYNLYKKILYTAIDNNKDLITDIIRINTGSDIKNNILLNIFNDMLLYIKFYYNKNIKFYTYSKTKDLNYNNIDKNFIINKSISLINNINDLKKYKDYNNTFITIDKNISIDLLNKSDIKYYLCKNNCNKCNNCNKYNNHITLCYKH